MNRKISAICLFLLVASNSYAVTINLGLQAAHDARDEVDSDLYGVNGALLWGSNTFMFGIGFIKNMQEISGTWGGYETVTLNFQFGGFYVNPFSGYRAISTNIDYLSDPNNHYRTQGVIFGYDLFIFNQVSLGVMGIYENPGKLDANATNPDYVELPSTVSPAIALKYWWW